MSGRERSSLEREIRENLARMGIDPNFRLSEEEKERLQLVGMDPEEFEKAQRELIRSRGGIERKNPFDAISAKRMIVSPYDPFSPHSKPQPLVAPDKIEEAFDIIIGIYRSRSSQ